jgi:hypothetical protein
MATAWSYVRPDTHAQERALRGERIIQQAPIFEGVSLTTSYVDLSTMVKLGFAFGGLSGKTDLSCFLLQIACYTKLVTVTTDRRGLALERQGVALRIGVASWDVSFDTAFNLAAVAASAELHNTGTAKQVQAYGQALSTLKIVGDLITHRNFDAEMVRMIGQAITDVGNLYVEKGDSLDPWPLAVASLPVSAFTPKNAALSAHLALESIWRQKSVIQTLNDIAGDSRYTNVDPTSVRCVYRDLGILDDSIKPTEQDKELAQEILEEGRF